MRNCLDVKHVEKNICDSIIDILLNIPGKTMDTIKVRLDLVKMCIREQLASEKCEQNTYWLPVCHTLFRKEKLKLCQWLDKIKMLSGYLSNIQRCVSMKDLKLVVLKSHDYHALLS